MTEVLVEPVLLNSMSKCFVQNCFKSMSSSVVNTNRALSFLIAFSILSILSLQLLLRPFKLVEIISMQLDAIAVGNSHCIKYY